jgi:ABC-type methionine transport system ATPase subunit
MSDDKVTRTVYLTFPKKVLSVPIFWSIPQKFKVVYNIRGASISDVKGLMALDLEGESTEIDRLVEYFKELGIKVELHASNELAFTSTEDEASREGEDDGVKPQGPSSQG